jgi:hypothetical protein
MAWIILAGSFSPGAISQQVPDGDEQGTAEEGFGDLDVLAKDEHWLPDVQRQSHQNHDANYSTEHSSEYAIGQTPSDNGFGYSTNDNGYTDIEQVAEGKAEQDWVAGQDK